MKNAKEMLAKSAAGTLSHQEVEQLLVERDYLARQYAYNRLALIDTLVEQNPNTTTEGIRNLARQLTERTSEREFAVSFLAWLMNSDVTAERGLITKPLMPPELQELLAD